MAGSGLLLQSVVTQAASSAGKIKAVAFDGFPILDPRPVFLLVTELFPEKGLELADLWRIKQFEYTWLRTLSGSYSDFRKVTSDALTFAARALKLDLTPVKQDRLLGAYLELRCWPDVPAALGLLKRSGLRLAMLSNLTEKMLQAGIRNSKLDGVFDYLLSTDRVRAYKPDPRAYQMGVDAFGVEPGQILFAAFAGWDAAGASAFGYPTFWVNRQNQPAEELGSVADANGENLHELVAFLHARQANYRSP